MSDSNETAGAAPEAVLRMVAATNAADSEAFADCFTEDAFLSDWGREFHGRDGVLSWDRTDNIGKRSHFTIVGSRRDGGDDVVTVTVTGEGYNGTSDIRFTVRGDRIARLVIAPD